MGHPKKSWDIAVLGAGASGLMAAVTAASCGCSVLLLERRERAGKKILATGNGRCNFTNEYMSGECFRGNRALADAVLPQFPKERTLDFFRSIGIYPKNRNGYYYPNSQTASSVLEALEAECHRLGVTLETLVTISDIHTEKRGFRLREENGRAWSCRRLILATGLLASPKLGSDGSALSLIEALGHRFTPILPALCGFSCEGMRFKRTSGVRTEASVRLYIDETLIAEDTGELQMADDGISGIPVFQISRFVSLALYEKKSPVIRIDFLPSIGGEALAEELARLFHGRKEPAAERMNGLLNRKLNPELMRAAGISPEIAAERMDKKRIHALVSALKSCPVFPTKPRGFEAAQVCAGGIRTEELTPQTLESRLIPGLYFAGELLDVDGICGGYNLQWAWSSGYAAGKHAVKSLRGEV